MAPGGGVSLRRKLAVVTGVYVIEGFPMGIFADVWPVFFRQAGLPLDLIGKLSGLSLAWVAKAFWSPLVDRYGEGRRWIAGALLTMALVLVAVPFAVPSHDALWLWLLVGVFCVASATQDIAIDAYTIGLVEHDEVAAANGVRLAAYRVALLLAGLGLLLLPDRIGWRATHFVAAGAALLLACMLPACPRVAIPSAGRKRTRDAFSSWQRRGGIISVLLFVMLYRMGDLAMAPMLKPFWVDSGLSLPEIAWISNAGGIVSTMTGIAVGSWIVARAGIGRALWIVGVLALASNLAYAGAALPGAGHAAIYAASLTEAFCGGLASAGFLAYLMRICDRHHAAIQYATLTALYAFPGRLAGMASGWGVERWGYAGFFAVTAGLALPAFLVLPGASRWADEEPPA